MKKNKMIKSLLSSAMFASVLIMVSCSDIPSYPSDSETRNAGSISCTIDDTTVVINPLDSYLENSFIRGFDTSADTEQSVSYKNTSGNDCDLYETLYDFGVNWVRLRVWNYPDSSKNPSVPGKSDKETVVAQAVRAKAAGHKVLLDFHYSDYWADPGKQLIPEAWLDYTTSDQMADAVSDYTTEVLEAMKAAKAEPDMIQIGNEISSGILKHKALDASENATAASDAVRGDFCSTNYFKYLAAGIEAARTACPDAKIMLHFTDIERNNPLNYLEKFSDLDYDIVGLSYYAEWASHGTLASLGTKIAGIKETYKKDVLVAETNAHYKYSEENDVLSEQYTANLVNADGTVYAGILTNADGEIIASVQNQANIVRAIIDVTVKNGGIGVFEWGGEYLGAWNSMFAGSGKPLASLAVFNIQ